MFRFTAYRSINRKIHTLDFLSSGMKCDRQNVENFLNTLDDRTLLLLNLNLQKRATIRSLEFLVWLLKNKYADHELYMLNGFIILANNDSQYDMFRLVHGKYVKSGRNKLHKKILISLKFF